MAYFSEAKNIVEPPSVILPQSDFLKLPSILGFLVTGIVIGPYGFSLIGASDQIEVISEVGVILLLFVIGMELSLKQLASIKNTVFIGGSLQVGLTILISGFAYYFLGNTIEEAVFVGFLFSLSSTAIVLKILQDRNEMKTAHGRNALAILIFQDIIVVPMMLITPILAGASDNVTMSIVMLLVKSIIVVIITIVSARYIVPKLMYAVAKTNSQELFLLTTIAICFAVAFLTSEAGLSLALGAFLAGLIISESEYSHQATSIILPFRELFTSIFFISIGMLLDLTFFLNNIGVVLLLVVVVFIIKALAVAIAVAVLKYPPRAVLLTALSLFQIGEFAFILSKVGVEFNLLSEETNQYFLAVSIVSMILTPFVIMFSHTMADRFLKTKLGRKIDKPLVAQQDSNELIDNEISNHLIIIGFGINGTNLEKAARYANIPHVVIEMDPAIVKKGQADGIPILFGDASQPHIWGDEQQFDRILLDVPCSATGVIRRHPDIKWLRRASDIEALAVLQSEIFDAMWRQLKVGGTLVYATCSITPQENSQQVSAFLQRTSDAQLINSDIENPGRQILPGEEDMDGFYYAVLRKA